MAGVTATPKTDRTVTLSDGRSVAYSEWGDLNGRPVVLVHGAPGSRLFCPDESATDAAHVRLITIDRPGYGRSDPRPDRSLLDWVEDYMELARLLELPPSPMVGWSSGGPYALACAARIPGRVPKVGVAASVGPWDEVPGAWSELPPAVQQLAELVRRDPVAAQEGFSKRYEWYADDWEGMFADVGPLPEDPDDQLLVRPQILEAMKTLMREGAKQGSSGYVADVIAEFLPWGFSLSDIETEALVWWGESDRLVTAAHAEYLAKTLPRSTLITYPGEGHLFLINHWAEMLAALL